jgi:hypothetical protein
MIQERAWTSSIWHLPGGPVPVQTTVLKLRDGSARLDPSRRRLTFKSSTRKDAPANRIVVPARGSAGDPTAGGATLTLYNPESGETWTVALPTSGWSADAAGSRYTFAGGSGPVQKVTVKADRITVKGGDSGLGYSLDEPRQGTLAVRLQLGAASPWCAEAPAKASGTPATTARFDAVDGFTGARRTPPPDQCPLVAGSPGGAFLVP